MHQKMKVFRFICWIAAWVGVVSTGDNPFNLIPPKTVDSLEIEAYTGRWYLMYTSLIPLSTYLQNGYCVTGDYYNPGNENGKVTFEVVNSQRIGGPNGELKQGAGTATNNFPDNAPGKFRLDLDSSSSPIDGLYWIVEVGEKDSQTGKYAWAIVSNPFGIDLFVLARDVDQFKTQLAPTAMQKAQEYGFTYSYNQPREVFQSTSECAYPPPPTPSQQ